MVAAFNSQTWRRAMPDLPDVLTVEEAATVLRIGRTAAYQLARQYIATNGLEGMPARRVGRQLRVPRGLLETWLGSALHAPMPDHASQQQQQHQQQPSPQPHNHAQLKLITNPTTP